MHPYRPSILTSRIFHPSQAALQRPDYPTGGILERAFRAHRRAMELPRGRGRSCTERFIIRKKGDAGRRGEEIEGIAGKMRSPQGRSFGIRLPQGYSSFQRG